MVISREICNCIDRHCNVHPSCSVVPIEFDATVWITCPVFDNLIRFSTECLKEVFEIFITDIFDAKVVNAQIEPHGMRDVLPQSGCVLDLKVAMSTQAFL